MRETFPLTKPKVTMAVDYDERLEAVLAAAVAICTRTGATLRLVHVCKPWTKSHLAPAVEGGAAGLVKALKDEVKRVAGRRLDALAATLERGFKVETAVLQGDEVKKLAADAEAHDVGLIVVGASRKDPSGLSTAVNLITESPCPVMVVDETTRFDPATTGWRILVADDLTDVAQSAVDLGLSLALGCPGSQVTHLHVESTMELDRLQKEAPAKDAGLTPQRLEAALRLAESEMTRRAGDGPARLEAAGGRYHTEVATGLVAEEIRCTALAVRADVVIFGEHQAMKGPTMHPGLVPFREMLTEPCPVIVVPQPR